MQRATLSIPVGGFVPGDTFHVFGDMDVNGEPTGVIDSDNPVTGDAPIPFWPLTEIPPGHLESPWLQDDWLGQPADVPDDHQVESPLLYHGWFMFEVVTYDAVLNASSGDPEETLVFVNSGPEPVNRFRQTGVTDGRPVFGFDAPPQLAA